MYCTKTLARLFAITLFCSLLTVAVLPCIAEERPGRPNILWLTCEDICPNLGCYGDQYAITPQLDQFAKEGVRYTQAVAVSGVCSINRSCLITGMYPSTIGSQDMRAKIRLSREIPTYAEILRKAGYYCTNNKKTDYNFPTPKKAWDACSGKAHWRNRKPGQPFFAVFNYLGTHESRVWEENHRKLAATLKPEELHDPDGAPVPPFQPNTPKVRRDWANYHDNITTLDHWIAKHLADLEKAGLADNTIVFFYSDHGAGLPGCKKWIWNWGLRVPLIIRFPEKYRHLAPSGPGTTSDRLVSFVDFPPTLLSLAGVDVPEHMQGKAFLGKQEKPPRRYAFAIRDRMIEWFDTIRVVRDKKYQYHRNFMPHLSWAPFCSYTLRTPTARIWTRLHEQGKLNPVQDRFFQIKPTEELYDLEADPHMINNLAADPKYDGVLRRMRGVLHDWQLETRDLGLLGEYEMHRRAKGRTQYDVGQSEKSYPLKRILPLAEMAGERKVENMPKLLDAIGDDDPAIRRWGVLGLVMLGKQAKPAEATLRECLKDDSPPVRVAAAEGLYQLGHVDVALDTLIKELSDPTPFVRVDAMGVLYRMGGDARPALPAIKKAGMKGIFPAEYLNRMVKYMPERLQ